MRNVYRDVKEEMCTGCGGCVAVCPQSCIELVLNEDGYYKRKVWEEQCVNCQQCVKVCSALCNVKELNCSSSYVIYAKDRRDALQSASGGVAHLLAESAIRNGYTVIGAVWDLKNYGVKHVFIDSYEELEKLRKSKYSQSYTVDVFRKIKTLSKFVMIGTPCQIAAARNLVGYRDDILLVDMDCMGPSGKNLLDKYISYLESLNSSGIQDIIMREKSKDWMNYGIRVVFKDGEEYYADKYKDPFCQCFNFAHAIQDTCLKHCKYINHSSADIRVGDAWEYAGLFPKNVARNGLSLVSVQTKQGLQWLKQIEFSVNVMKVAREMPKKISFPMDKNVMESLRNRDETIWNAVQIYNNQPPRIKFVRKTEELISRNYDLYIMMKKIKKRLIRNKE